MNQNMTKWLLAAGLTGAVLAATGCSEFDRYNYLDPQRAPVGEGWVGLCNGEDLTGWHKRPGHNREMSWKVVDGVMVNESTHEKKGVDIVTDAEYEDFEIYYEYKIPEGSNSGVYLRGRYEIQVLDDYGQEPAGHSNGGLYSKCPPAKNASKPAGEWQSVYAEIDDMTINVWLNGVHTVKGFEVDGQTGGALDEDYGTPGPIMIQGDHGGIEVRNIMIKPDDD